VVRKLKFVKREPFTIVDLTYAACNYVWLAMGHYKYRENSHDGTGRTRTAGSGHRSTHRGHPPEC
jgi:hypothetical protein